MDKVIITAAICGAEVTRSHTPYIPITAQELGEEASRCVEAGASIIHLHVRNNEGKPTQEIGFYKKAFSEIKKHCRILPIIQPSTGGALGMTVKERSNPLKLLPEMATLDCGSVNFGNDVFINDLKMIQNFAVTMKKLDIMPELECFEIGHIHNALILLKKGMVSGHLHFDFVLGVKGAMNGSAGSLMNMINSIPPGATWSVAGIGANELPLAYIALAMEGHVRVGLEDNLYYKKGQLSQGSAPLVARITELARELGREPATPDEARKILKIPLKRKNRIKFS